MRKWMRSLIVLAALPPAPPSRAQTPEFTLGFDGPDEVRGSPGEVVTFECHVTLATEASPSPGGAQGWSISFTVDGGKPLSVSLDGLVVSTIFDHDGDRLDPDGTPNPDPTPPIDPYLLELSRAGFQAAALVGRGPLPGGISGVVLHLTKAMALQPAGTQRIARFTVEAIVPPDGDCAAVGLEFETSWCCGQPVTNTVIREGTTVSPRERGRTIRLCPSRFRRGDANSDGGVDISDAISALSFLYLGGRTPACLDSADVNDDGWTDISDAIFLLVDLFSSAVESAIPAPSIYCGHDPTPDGVTCDDGSTCP